MHACGYSGAKAGKKSVTPPAALVKRNILQQMLVRTLVDNTDLLEILMQLTEMPLLSSKQKHRKAQKSKNLMLAGECKPVFVRAGYFHWEREKKKRALDWVKVWQEDWLLWPFSARDSHALKCKGFLQGG